MHYLLAIFLFFMSLPTAIAGEVDKTVVSFYQNVQAGNFGKAFELTKESYLNEQTFSERVEPFKYAALKKVRVTSQDESQAFVTLHLIVPSSLGKPFKYTSEMHLVKVRGEWKIDFLYEPQSKASQKPLI